MTLTSILQNRVLFGTSLNVTGLALANSVRANSVAIRPTTSLDSNPDLDITNPASQHIKVYVALNAGGYNGLTQSNDKAIIFSDGTVNTGDMVIGPWSNSANGIRIVGATGNVGIGTASPTQKLTVNGGFRATEAFLQNPSGETRLEIGGTNNVYIDLKKPDADNYDLRITTDFTASSIETAVGQNLSINVTGQNVGIGTAAPVRKLHVNGFTRLEGTPAYPSNAAAIAGGLSVYDVYRTASGELRMVV